jgi:ribosomal-protein-alanine N-acetyltransferase
MNDEFSLSTARLRLRPWREEDLAPFAALNADPRVMRYFKQPLTRAESDAFVERTMNHFREHGFCFWAIELRETRALVGLAGLSRATFPAHFTPCVEVGWRLAHDHWGRGFATEAAEAALDDGFGRLGLAEIVAFTAVGNERSRRVMDRLGMTRSAADDFDHPNLPPGHPLQRHVLYRATRSAWKRA